MDINQRIKGEDWPLTGVTMIGQKRLINIEWALRFVVANAVPGDFIECGVWRGGSSIFARAVLKALNNHDKHVWLADSFQGLPKARTKNDNDNWSKMEYLKVSLEEVQTNFRAFNLLDDHVHFCKGYFVDSLPRCNISQIAVLRMDGDMYVHRSRHFGNGLQANNIYESYHNSSLTSSSSSLNDSNIFHLRRHCREIIQKRRVTIILICCLFVALLLWTPQSLSLTYETLIESYSEMTHKHRIILLIFNNFSNLFLCINASIDFILYCFLSEKFARTCKEIICRLCSNYNFHRIQRIRFLSLDRTSIILSNTSKNLYQQQLTTNATNKYYQQLYDICRNSSNIKNNQNKKSKKKFDHPIDINIKSDNYIFYQKALLKTNQRLKYTKSCRTPMNKISNPVLDYTNENDVNNETNYSINRLVMNSTKPSCSELVSPV
ncbi:unnamed protein product [Rotaria sordida]|uniref:Macrocin O-methyltransferase n=1 Tax=Rotaria sordida TaxID=392033 RepID=A0A815CN87_9BILA|nr:unnamed protein product [Rotaria sordida]